MFKLLAICVLCFNIFTQARSLSTYQMGDVLIERSDDKWKCDKIECPPDTDRCFVSKSNKVEPSILKRVNYCYSKDNQILKQYVNETPVDPKSKINMQITSTSNGNVSSNGGSLEDFDEEKFNHEMNQMQANLNSQMANMDKELENQMQHLHSNLQNMNENINKNLQNQMDNLHENLAQMQYNLDHMFD
ncbi:asparagine-rich protein-like [Calliphora vicina]|uniref:asparagine-rich protein-like n=1 Tax=Calliphora vicina TaxID=7373 RepID=UPI00325B7630